MPRPPVGPPPVDRAVAVQSPNGLQKADDTYMKVIESFKANSASARAIKSMLGGDKAAVERFLAVVFSSLQDDSDLLLNASVMSIVQAVRDAADLGLEPTGLNGEAAIIRYANQAQLVPMWRGYLKRIRNSGAVAGIDVQLVYAEDDFSLTLGTNPSITHVPAILEQADDGEILTPRGGYKGAYAWALLNTGFREIEWMPTADINYIRDTFSRSRSNNSPWATSWGEMARKTVIRRLAKRLAQESVNIQRLLEVEARADLLAASLQSNGKESKSEGVSAARLAALAATAGKAPPREPAASEDRPESAQETPAAETQPVEPVETPEPVEPVETSGDPNEPPPPEIGW